MKKHQQHSSIWPGLFLVCWGILLFAATQAARGDVHTWDGSTSGNWGTGANWDTGTVPADGDDLVFPDGPTRLATTNNTSSSHQYRSITIAGANYALRGNSLILSNGIRATYPAVSSSSVELNITLARSQAIDVTTDNAVLFISGDIDLGASTLTVDSTGNTLLGGVISGTGGITKIGTGDLRLYGTQANTYTGPTRVSVGTLELNKIDVNAMAGDLIVGNSAGTDTVRWLRCCQLTSTNEVTVNEGALLDLNGFNETLGDLSVNAGTVETGDGLLSVIGLLTGTSTTNRPGLIFGRMGLGSATRTISINQSGNYPELRIYASISGTGGILKTGDGVLGLPGSNTFSGLVTVSEGGLYVENNDALGSTSSGTIVQNGADLGIGPLIEGGSVNVGNEALTLNDSVFHTMWRGSCSWAGPITLAADARISAHTNFFMTLSGAIGGAGGFRKISSGTLRLSGTNANTFIGDVYVDAGTLELDKNAMDGALPGPGDLFIGDGNGGGRVDVVRELRNYQIEGSVDITIVESGHLDLNDHSDSVGGLNITGGRIDTGTGTLTLGGNVTGGSVPLYSGVIFGRLSLGSVERTFDIAHGGTSPSFFIGADISGGGGIRKIGLGMMGLGGSNTYNGLTTVAAGTLCLWPDAVPGSTNQGTVVEDGGALLLNGTHVGNEALNIRGIGPGAGALIAGWIAKFTNSWAGPITLAGDTTIKVGDTNELILSGVIQGPGGLTKIGPDILTLAGTAQNTYAGDTRVEEGTLLLGKTSGMAIRNGNLFIGDGVGGSAADVVTYLDDDQIHAAVTITISASGRLDLRNYTDDVGSLILTGGYATMGASGHMGLYGAYVIATNGPGLLYGRYELPAGRTFYAAGASNADLYVYGDLSGTGGLTKTGPGRLYLSGSNSYEGLTTITEGKIEAADDYALGSAIAGTIVRDGASLLLRTDRRIVGEALTLSGEGLSTDGALAATVGSNVWTGPITLNGDTRLTTRDTDNYLYLSGAISGSGNLAIEGPGTIILAGAPANTFVGNTLLNQGKLHLNKTALNGAIPGKLMVGDGIGAANTDVVILLQGSQIANTAAVVIARSGWLDLHGNTETIGSLAGDGRLTLDDGVFITGYDNSSTIFSGPITGSGGTVTKMGTGSFTLSNSNTYSGLTTVGNGTLIVNGDQPSSPVQVNASSTLGGRGRVGTITGASGTIAPGTSPGMLSGSNTVLDAMSTFDVELAGLTAGTGYDQLNISGSVSLGTANLHLTVDCAPAEGDQFRIINNNGTDAVIGTFQGLPNGAVLTAGGLSFLVNYAGGTGNDVVLVITNTALLATNVTVVSGNANGVLDPAECNMLRVLLYNRAMTPVVGITTELSSTTPGVWITQPQSVYPNISPHAAMPNVRPFQVSTLPGFACGTNVELALRVTTSNFGVFTIRFTLPSGSPGTQYEYGNSVPALITDGGSVDSAVLVTNLVSPIAEVEVSCHINHPNAADLDVYLLAPDGSIIDLSSDNGGTGDNYGTSCVAGERTVFSDAGSVSITSRPAPFVGRFKPEEPLSALRGKVLNGTWRLRVMDDTAGNSGSLQCWSLYLAQAQCIGGGGPCTPCPDQVISGAITTEDLSYTDRLTQNGVASDCTSRKRCPGERGDVDLRRYDMYPFRNGASNACVTVSLATTNLLFSAVYMNGFDPGDLCANYLADAGAPGAQSYSFNIEPGKFFAVMVSELNAGSSAGGPGYTLTVSGGSCLPWLEIARGAEDDRVVLSWPTFAYDGHLAATGDLSPASPVFTPLTYTPVTVNRYYTVTNVVTPTNRFYRLER